MFSLFSQSVLFLIPNSKKKYCNFSLISFYFVKIIISTLHGRGRTLMKR